MSAATDVTLIADAGDLLGEAPMWHEGEQTLYWVDIERPCLARLEAGGSVRRWPMPEMIGCFAFRETPDDHGHLVAALRSGFHFIELETGSVTAIADPEPDEPDHRFNDGKCDPSGRFWSGTLDLALKPAAREGTLYRLDVDLSCHQVLDGLSTTNGLAWSPDGATMYLADSRAGVVYAFDFDGATGTPDNRRTFFTTDDVQGRVDGATVDTDGTYWCAMFDGACLARYDPDGRRMLIIDLPVRFPTMCTFGGPDLDVLYVTSASRFEAASGGRPLPGAGALYAVTGCGSRGLPADMFAG